MMRAVQKEDKPQMISMYSDGIVIIDKRIGRLILIINSLLLYGVPIGIGVPINK